MKRDIDERELQALIRACNDRLTPVTGGVCLALVQLGLAIRVSESGIDVSGTSDDWDPSDTVTIQSDAADCDICNGWGRVDCVDVSLDAGRGMTVSGQKTVPCPGCNGSGKQ